jgi:hypothetical protein
VSVFLLWVSDCTVNSYLMRACCTGVMELTNVKAGA